MKNFNGTDEEFWKERKRLCKEHNINMIRAGCYMNNYYDDFLCETCHCVDSCGKINEVEGEKTGDVTGEEHIQDSVTEATDA